ncbi:MAG: T9SS type A sorting domain-containing protein [Bacteroidales bacterium]|nr:T9SS type A sorting domain-containing protein [Bacteroidales bacterium]
MPYILFILLTFRMAITGSMAVATTGRADVKSSFITHQEYDQRMDLYDVKFYKIDLEVTNTSTFLAGSASVLLQVLDIPVTELVFDLLSDIAVDSVLVDGKHTSFLHENNLLQVLPSTAIQPQSTVSATVYYSGLGQQLQWISGVYYANQDAWKKDITWTLSEPFAARNWFPCKQVLSDKADSAYIFLTTGKGLRAGSNGILENTTVLPGNKIRYEWKTRYPIAYYLLSFAVGDYFDYSFYVRLPGSGDSLLVQNYIFDSLNYLQQNKEDIDKTADLLCLYSDLFGIYPFYKEKYGHCVAPLGGGMEHQTMTTLSGFSFLLVAHELAHQWFGDYVTCSSWQDIWINEGFASYAEYIACQYLKTQTDAYLWMADAHEYIKSQDDGSVFVPEEDADDEGRIFDYRLSYKKGAAIIHMIRGELQNDSLFFAVIRDYLNRHKNDLASGEDFKRLLEEKTQNDFSTFFNQWYYGEGYPSITLNWNHEKDTLYLYALLTSSAPVTPVYNLLTGYKIKLNYRDTTVYRRHSTNYDEWKMYLPGNIESVEVDPGHWLLLTVKGVNNLSKRDSDKTFYLAPNPAKDRISIYFADSLEEKKIYVIDSAGKIVFEDKTKNFPYTIDLAGYKPGIFVVLLEDETSIYTDKFIRPSR